MYEVIRTRFDDQYEKPISDIIRFIAEYDELVRFVRRTNEMFCRNRLAVIITFREKGSPIIRTIDKNGTPRPLNVRAVKASAHEPDNDGYAG